MTEIETDAEQSAEEKAVEREKKRKYQAQRRLKIKQAEAAAQAVLDNQTLEEFWQKNRTTAKQAHIVELQDREQLVLGILDDMQTVMEGRSPDDDYMADTAMEVRDDVAEHGVCAIETGLLNFHRNPIVFAMLTQRNDATAVFVRYGIVVALSSHRLHQWQEWVASKKAVASPVEPVGSGWTTLRCARNCGHMGTCVPQSIADGYKEKGIQYLCHRCRIAEMKARGQANVSMTMRTDDLRGMKLEVRIAEPEKAGTHHVVGKWNRAVSCETIIG